jgi:hypothetical protein
MKTVNTILNGEKLFPLLLLSDGLIAMGIDFLHRFCRMQNNDAPAVLLKSNDVVRTDELLLSCALWAFCCKLCQKLTSKSTAISIIQQLL